MSTEHELSLISKTDLDYIKRAMCKDASQSEFDYCIKVAKLYGLNPIAGEIYFLKTKDGYKPHISIDVMRKIIRKEIDGGVKILFSDDGAQWVEAYVKEGGPKACKATVYRKGHNNPIEAVILMREYNTNTFVWKQRPCTMLAKCAESLVYRKAFSDLLSNLNTLEDQNSVVPSVEGDGLFDVPSGVYEGSNKDKCRLYEAVSKTQGDFSTDEMKDFCTMYSRNKVGVSWVDIRHELETVSWQDIMSHMQSLPSRTP